MPTLRQSRNGTIPPDRLVYAVLEGPPGTGKTLIASSLAQTAGWSFVAGSMGEWFTVGDGALGGVAKNIRAFFDQLIQTAPSVGLLDEVDSVPDRVTIDNRGSDWWTPVVTLLLTEIDRLRRSGKPILLLGATNFYHKLDSALVRPGRIQKRVPVLAAETETRVDGVAALLPQARPHRCRTGQVGAPRRWLDTGDGGRVGQRRRGRSPVLLDGLSRSHDLLEQMLPQDQRTVEDIRTIAFHEIGHAVVAHRLGIKVEQVTIVPKDDSGGHTKTLMSSIVPTWERICDIVTTTLAGRAADIVLGSGPNAGAESDLANATTILLNAIERQGLRGALIHMPEMGMRRSEVMMTVEAQLTRLLKRAIAIVEADRQLAIELAERLIEERILRGVDIARALEAGPRTPQEPKPRVRATGGRQALRPNAVARRSA